jgi:hypothetical protein
LEGEDPIALAILVDTAHIATGTGSRLVDAIARLMPGSLRAADTVSLYKLDCQVSRVVVPRPTTPAGLRQGAELLFGKHKDQPPGGAEPCRTQWNLVDSIVSAVQGIQDEPSRRVLLVVSDGQDRDSRTTWDAARFYAMTHGVAIFASVESLSLNLPIVGRRGVIGVQAAPIQNDLPQFCENTGGMAVDDSDTGIVHRMHDFLVLVRSRYIVELPPPPASEPKTHVAVVSVEKLDAFIRTAGVSYSLPDPESTEDPNAIRTAPADASDAGVTPP